MDKLSIIQADRDAAADFLSLLASDDIREWEAIGNLRTGEHDDNPAVKSFAAHRIASQAELVRTVEAHAALYSETSEARQALRNVAATLSHTKGEGE